MTVVVQFNLVRVELLQTVGIVCHCAVIFVAIQIQSSRLAEDFLAALESPPGVDVVVAGFIGAYAGDAHIEKITKVLDGKVNPLVRDAGLSSAF